MQFECLRQFSSSGSHLLPLLLDLFRSTCSYFHPIKQNSEQINPRRLFAIRSHAACWTWRMPVKGKKDQQDNNMNSSCTQHARPTYRSYCRPRKRPGAKRDGSAAAGKTACTVCLRHQPSVSTHRSRTSTFPLAGGLQGFKSNIRHSILC